MFRRTGGGNPAHVSQGGNTGPEADPKGDQGPVCERHPADGQGGHHTAGAAGGEPVSMMIDLQWISNQERVWMWGDETE